MDTQTHPNATDVAKSKPRISWMSKTFWGLIGLLALSAIGLIAMAMMALKEHTYEAPVVANKTEAGVEIIELGGKTHTVSTGLVPTNPVGVDENLVNAGTAASDAQNALAQNKVKGTQLVESVKPQAVVQKSEVAKISSDKQMAKADASASKAERTVQHKEANAQMDNLF